MRALHSATGERKGRSAELAFRFALDLALVGNFDPQSSEQYVLCTAGRGHLMVHAGSVGSVAPSPFRFITHGTNRPILGVAIQEAQALAHHCDIYEARDGEVALENSPRPMQPRR